MIRHYWETLRENFPTVEAWFIRHWAEVAAVASGFVLGWWVRGW